MHRISSWQCNTQIIRKASADCGHKQHDSAKAIVTEVEFVGERFLKYRSM